MDHTPSPPGQNSLRTWQVQVQELGLPKPRKRVSIWSRPRPMYCMPWARMRVPYCLDCGSILSRGQSPGLCAVIAAGDRILAVWYALHGLGELLCLAKLLSRFGFKVKWNAPCGQSGKTLAEAAAAKTVFSITPPLVLPHPREDSPPPPPGGRSPSDSPPAPPGGPHYHRKRTFAGTEIAA